MALEFLQSLLARSSVQASRSTAIGPLLWALLIVVAGLIAGHECGLPTWATGLLAGGVAFLIVNLAGMCWYFAIHQPDALRSERFAIAKMAMEKRRIEGDTVLGVVEAFLDDPADRAGTVPGKRGVRPTTHPRGLSTPGATRTGEGPADGGEATAP